MISHFPQKQMLTLCSMFVWGLGLLIVHTPAFWSILAGAVALGYVLASFQKSHSADVLKAEIKTLQRKQSQLVEHNQTLHKIANEDPLTGVANRRYFEKQGAWSLQSAIADSTCLSLILCDIDFFKQYNDMLGHQAGDICLQYVAHTLESNLRQPGDFVARYGGEEFVILLPNTSAREAEHIARRVQGALAQRALPHPRSQYKHVTLSMGVATHTPRNPMTLKAMIAKADKALYNAKALGRNTISQELKV